MLFRERLTVPIIWWVLAGLFSLSVLIAVGAYLGPAWGVGTSVAMLLVATAIFGSASIVISVDEEARKREDEEQQDEPGEDVEGVERTLTVEERREPAAAGARLGEGQHRVETDDQRGSREDPVDRPGVVAAVCAAPRPPAVEEEGERQGDAEEDDQVVLVALAKRPEDLPEHERRDGEAPHRHRLVPAGRQPPRRPLLVVLGGESIEVGLVDRGLAVGGRHEG